MTVTPISAPMSEPVSADEDDRRPGLWTAIAMFLALAYGLSWWPALGRMGNPDSAVVFPIGPSIAALVVAGWVHGRGGRRRILVSTFDHRRLRRMWPVLLIPPAIGTVAVAAHLVTGGSAPDAADIGSSMLMFAALPLTAIVSGPLGEELGWRGFLLPHLLQRYSAIAATAVLVPMWLVFHLPLSIVDPDRYGPLWALNVTGIAITMTWVHLRTAGSVLMAVLFHAVANTSTGAAVLLFPEDERTEPWAIATGTWLLVATVVAWGPLRHAGAHPRHATVATETSTRTSTRKDPHDRRTTPQ